jgi:DNA-binding NarL/FixJ family response regulator
MIIGRQSQLQQLNDELALVRRGQGRVVLLAGEAGVGKTRLVQAFIEQLQQADGLEVLIGHCYDLQPAAPYGPFTELVRLLVEAHGAEELLASLGPWSGDLARLLPELTLAGRSPLIDTPSDKHQLFEAIVRTLRPQQGRCRIIVIEDLHWSDPTSQELFHYLARAIEREAVLLIGTYRSDELHRLHPLAGLLARLSRDRLLRELRLSRLSRGELSQLLSQRIERDVSGRFVDTLYERTEGNPFFAEEVVDSLVGQGQLEGLLQATAEGRRVDELAIPLSIRESVTRRAADLDPTTSGVLRAAAVVGRSFTFELLAVLTALPEAELLAALARLVERQLIIEEPGHEDRYTFRHELIRQALNDELLRRERRIQHRNVLHALEQLYAAHDEAVIDQLAYHSLRARDSERTLRYSQRAGDRAARMHAYREALGHYEAALEVGDELAASERAALLTRFGHVAYPLREHQVANDAWAEAFDLYAQVGDVRQQAELLRWLARLAWERNERDTAFKQVKTAMALLEHEPPCREQAMALSALSQLHMLSLDFAESIRWGEQALALAEQLGEQQVIAHALNNLGASRTSLGDDECGLAELRRSLQISRAGGWVADALRAYVNLGGRLHETGYLREAQQVLLEGLAYAKDMGWEQHIPQMLINLSSTELDLGAWDEALQRITQFTQALATMDDSMRWTSMIQQAYLLLYRGQIVEAERLYKQLQGQVTAKHEAAVVALGFELARIRNDQAAIAPLVEQLLTEMQQHSRKKPHRVLDYTNLIRVMYDLGQHERANALVNEVSERAAQSPWHWNKALGALMQGIRAMAQGDPQAVEYFAEAAIFFEQHEHAPAHCFVLRMQAAARIQRNKGDDHTVAQTLLRTARSIAERIGMPLELQEIAALEQRLLPSRPAERTLDALTPREQQVLELIRLGHSNRAIAEVLVISEKTAEVHVRNILSKLGVASRTQAAVLRQD